MTVSRSFDGKTVCVTGGAGFIGSHLVDRLLKENVEHVVVIDNLFLGNEDNLTAACATGRVTLYKEDCELQSSLDYIFGQRKIEIVFNCATKALNYSFLNPSNAFETNTRSVLNLLELQRKGAFKTLCHFSTSEVYGTAVYEPMDEAHPKHPTTTYAAGKAAADMAIESYTKMFGVDAFIVRPFNNYGPRQNHKGLLAGIIPITAWRILQGRRPELHGSGKQSRDFIHVRDTVEAVIKLFYVMPSGESVNVSSDGQVTIRELIERICDHYGYRGPIDVKPARDADVLCHNASNAKVNSLIDFKLTPFKMGLPATLEWYRAKLKAK